MGYNQLLRKFDDLRDAIQIEIGQRVSLLCPNQNDLVQLSVREYIPIDGEFDWYDQFEICALGYCNEFEGASIYSNAVDMWLELGCVPTYTLLSILRQLEKGEYKILI